MKTEYEGMDELSELIHNASWIKQTDFQEMLVLLSKRYEDSENKIKEYENLLRIRKSCSDITQKVSVQSLMFLNSLLLQTLDFFNRISRTVNNLDEE